MKQAIIIEVPEFEAEKLLIRDNLFRRHMGGMELARAIDAYAKLSDSQTRKSIRQIADEIGENRNTVHFYMKLNNLIPEFQQLIDDKKLTVTAAQAFASMDEEEQRKLYNTAPEQVKTSKEKKNNLLSKLDTVDSIIASMSFASINIYDSKTLFLLDEKLKAISAILSDLSGSISAAIQNKRNNEDLEN